MNPRHPAPKQSDKIFLAVYSGFWLFSVDFDYSLDIFKTAVSGCSGAVCGHLCGQKRFSPQTGGFFTGPGREAFRVSGWLDCNSDRGVMQVFSAEEAAQSLRGDKQRKNPNRLCVKRRLI
ncbi:MAG: hypothetical protein SO441_00825 [Candidatus Limivicinus sp.]|nr:hypothetical protein [Candidatus Limivicinus sp.]